jgi:hypothetical protein
MKRISMAVMIALFCFGAAGCIAPPQGEQKASTPAPPIAGTLYVFHTSSTPRGAQGVEVWRDGKLLAHPAPGDVLIARDKPAIRLSTAPLFGKARNDPKICDPVAISPDGMWAACLRSDGRGTVTVFKIADPQHTQRSTSLHVTVYSRRMAGFEGHALAVAADDDTCPAFYRTDAQFAFEPRARLYVIDTNGKRLHKGPCIHGVIAGAHKLAFISHDTREQPFYSYNGTNWNPGLALTFDGTDHLLILNQYDQLIDEQGRLVSDDVVDAWWTR